MSETVLLMCCIPILLFLATFTQELFNKSYSNNGQVLQEGKTDSLVCDNSFQLFLRQRSSNWGLGPLWVLQPPSGGGSQIVKGHHLGPPDQGRCRCEYARVHVGSGAMWGGRVWGLGGSKG